MRIRRTLMPLALALGLTLALFWGLSSWVAPAEAMPRAVESATRTDQAPALPQYELHVCPSGCDYASIQDAIDDASPGAVIKVAEGTYSQLGYQGSYAQVVHVDKSLTIQGGYAAGNWSTPDPDAHPTVVDALGDGHAVIIGTFTSRRQAGPASLINATLSGLHLTGGAGSSCGGVLIQGADATLIDNHIYGNNTYVGAGLCVELDSTAHLIRNVIRDNVAQYDGGGIYAYSSELWLVNNVIVDNQAGGAGAGAYLRDSSASLVHTTIARNGSIVQAAARSAGAPLAPATSNGSGVYLASNTSAELVNTILADHGVGIQAESNSFANLNGVLWSGNGMDTAGSGSIMTSHEVSGSPNFAGDGYHIGSGSAAIDQGVSSSAGDDIDGDPRPMGSRPDLGADETASSAPVDPDTGDTLTYTDTQGLTTTVEIPPGAVAHTATFTLKPILTPTHPFTDGIQFANHAFELDVIFVDMPAAISVTKSATPTQVPEPEGEVAFSVVITNTSMTTDATITRMEDTPYGDVTDPENPELSGTDCQTVTIPPAHCYRCTFTATVSGSPGDLVSDTITVEGTGGDGTSVSAHSAVTVTVVDLASSIQVTNTATVTELMAPGGPVTFTLHVANASAVDTVTLTALEGDLHGDLTDPQNPGLLNTTCHTTTLAPDDVYQCAFAAMVTGQAGEEVTDTVTVHGIDDDGQPVEASTSAVVRLTGYRIYLPLVVRDGAGGSVALNVTDAPGWSWTVPSQAVKRGDAGCSMGAENPYPCVPKLQKPLTVTIRYSCADVEGIDENNLRLYYWTGTQWRDVIDACPKPLTYTRDVDANILQVPVCHLSRFALGG